MKHCKALSRKPALAQEGGTTGGFQSNLAVKMQFLVTFTGQIIQLIFQFSTGRPF